jgi:hypothetical protein
MGWFKNLSFSKRLNLIMVCSLAILSLIFLAISYQRQKTVAMKLMVERLRVAAGFITEQLGNSRTYTFPEQGYPTCYNPQELQKQMTRISGHRRATVRLLSYDTVNSAYTPDTYEAQQMRWLKTGAVADTSIVVSLNDEKSVFYIKSLIARDLCLTCHGTYETVSPEIREFYPASSRMFNHKSGQVMGAIAVTLPLAPLREVLMINLLHDFFVLMVGGLVLILIMNIVIQHQLAAETSRLASKCRNDVNPSIQRSNRYQEQGLRAMGKQAE